MYYQTIVPQNHYSQSLVDHRYDLIIAIILWLIFKLHDLRIAAGYKIVSI